MKDCPEPLTPQKSKKSLWVASLRLSKPPPGYVRLRLGLPRYVKALGGGLAQLPPTTQSPCLFPGVQGKCQKTRVLGPKSQIQGAESRGMQGQEACAGKTSAKHGSSVSSTFQVHSTASKKKKTGKQSLGQPQAGRSWRALPGRLSPGRGQRLAFCQQTLSFACSTKLPSWAGTPGLGEQREAAVIDTSLVGGLPTLLV